MKRMPKWEIVFSVILLLILILFARTDNPQKHIVALTFIGRLLGAVILVFSACFAAYLYAKNGRMDIQQKHFSIMLAVISFFIFSFVETINSITSQNRLFFSLSLGLFGFTSGVFVAKHYWHLHMQKFKPIAPVPKRPR